MAEHTMAETVPQQICHSDDVTSIPARTKNKISTAALRASQPSFSSEHDQHGAVMGIRDAADFQDRLDSLPRELYDMVKAHTLSAHTEDSQLLFHLSQGRRRYAQHLKIIHLTRATRRLYIPAFYSQPTFTFELISDLHRWLDSVAAEHRDFIMKLYLILPPGTLVDAVPPRGKFVDGAIRSGLKRQFHSDHLTQELSIHEGQIENFDFERWNEAYAFDRARWLGLRD